MVGQGCTARGERIVGGLRRTVEEEMRRRGDVGYGCSSDEEGRGRERECASQKDTVALYMVLTTQRLPSSRSVSDR